MSGRGIGFGKTILFGEHFVVYGLPAIASAISNYTLAEVEEAKEKGWHLEDNRPAVEGYKEKKQGEIKRSLDLIFDYLNIDLEKKPIKIRLSGNLKAASGIGASAALASSVARALNQHFALGLNDDEINRVAYEGEKGSAGTPSGIDNTCSTYGGMLVFQKNLEGGLNKIIKLKPKEPLKVVLASTGITQETKKVVSEVRLDKEKNPQKYEKIFEEYSKIFEEAKKSIEQGELKRVGELMNKNQELLKQINVSCPEIEEITRIALKNGALGAKLTGTGRGGLVVCLVKSNEDQEKVASSIEESGFETTKTRLGESI